MQEYISDVPNELDYPTINRLKDARSSGQMPSIEEAAAINAKAIERLQEYESGSFLDVRKI